MQEDIIKQYEGHEVDGETQEMLNKPATDNTGFNPGHEEFLKMLIQTLETGKLETHKPETLYNKAIYEALPEEKQEKASLTAINLMSTIRQIESLWKIDKSPSFQIQNLVETVFQMKSKFESEHGDVYVI